MGGGGNFTGPLPEGGTMLKMVGDQCCRQLNEKWL